MDRFDESSIEEMFLYYIDAIKTDTERRVHSKIQRELIEVPTIDMIKDILIRYIDSYVNTFKFKVISDGSRVNYPTRMKLDKVADNLEQLKTNPLLDEIAQDVLNNVFSELV